MFSRLMTLLQGPAAGGILLGFAAIFAMLVANSPIYPLYDALLTAPVVVQVGALEIAKPLLLWVNDGLMAIFFFLVGLELKRECMVGELNHWRKAVLPGVGALGGIICPALVYLFFNYDEAAYARGWAIPAATDIAFALGVLSLLGPRVPISLKVFLTSVAIFDDVGAILIIALFYTSKISTTSLIIAAVCCVALWILNRREVILKWPYLVVGLIMWVAVLKSGVHATLAGVVLALFIPMTSDKKFAYGDMLTTIEHKLYVPVTYCILPVFAFFNSGLVFSGFGFDELTHPVPLGIALGLFIGKQLGVFSFSWLAIQAGIAQRPRGVDNAMLYGVACLTGIGFTMSLFIGALAFDATALFDERFGIVLGSLASGLLGFFILKRKLQATSTSSQQPFTAGEIP